MNSSSGEHGEKHKELHCRLGKHLPDRFCMMERRAVHYKDGIRLWLATIVWVELLDETLENGGIR